jgi:glycosyltransferase involved in cell wall biosynthesis
MKILLSAYACAPEQGSEPEVGFQTMLAAARRHEVWVLTQRHMAERVHRFLAGRPEAARIHLVVVDPPDPERRDGVWELALTHWRHDQWQRRAARRAVELDRRVDFDVVHHVTLAGYWMRTGVAAVGKPLVWGPVGGGVEPPWRLASELGMLGLMESGVRTGMRRIVGRVSSSRATLGAAVVFAQNEATARRIHSRADVVVLANGTSVGIGAVPPVGSRTGEIAFVGHLAPWKGGRLAVRAMRYVRQPGAVLHIYGKGAEHGRILKAARRWGVEDRVRLEGRILRCELLPRVARAGVLLQPSLHEESGLAAAEALSMGTPLVCLDHGGPAELVRQWPQSPSAAIRPGWPDETARALAAAVDWFLADPPPPPLVLLPPKDSFADRILEAYEQAARPGGRSRPPSSD